MAAACRSRLRLEPRTLTWEAPLRGGELPVSAITSVRPMHLGSSVVVIEHDRGRPVLVIGGKDLRNLIDDLSRMPPTWTCAWVAGTAGTPSARSFRLAGP
jgi:hypothetical protein